MSEAKSSKRKNGLVLNWRMLLDDDDDDDHTPELVITPSDKPKPTEYADVDYRRKSDEELQSMIKKHQGYLSNLFLKDNGDKIKATIRKYEAELQRRQLNKDGEEAMLLSDHSDDGASCRKDRRDQKSSTFGDMFSKKIDQNARTVNAFDKELSFINPRQGRTASQNGRFPAPQDKPSTKLKPKPPSSYNLVDEDMEEDPHVSNTTLYAETLSDCMKDVKVRYPSREDRDPVEVTYTDMECLAPEAYLSSTIMNFYIRYIQQSSSSEYRTCNYHFFNTYFYNKLQKLSYREDSFLKFRKWWKGVNIFEKAYILLPVHDCAHWSLGIISIPTKKDELGPIILHLDSLSFHNSSSIFDNIRRFLKEEWNYLRNSEVPLDLPIADEIWDNLDHRIIDRKMQVPQQKNAHDCGLFVLYYMERFIKEAPERLTEKDISMFGRQWFLPEEASNLRVRIHNLLVQEFKNAKDKETILSP
ncbi:hypothetical protein M8C21_003055 [Ambrosia artemisiifolia]|uniref:Ubiquitin-like protease family profile domain-containing protein n=1 Tax=Ambrosia artemisiifolia TaxID=4212 RepID=A0AAD5GAD4_AMBAR|nr:hypothetical protein M8C21_003055 [Ambrosia artemisiifolia]